MTEPAAKEILMRRHTVPFIALLMLIPFTATADEPPHNSNVLSEKNTCSSAEELDRMSVPLGAWRVIEKSRVHRIEERSQTVIYMVATDRSFRVRQQRVMLLGIEHSCTEQIITTSVN